MNRDRMAAQKGKGSPMIKIFAAVLVLAATAAHAGERAARDMTCRGRLEGPANFRVIGPDARICYVTDPALLELVNASCQEGITCVVRAHVVPRDTPNGMPPAWTVKRIYSIRTELPRRPTR
jgi:hypothetical protein